MCPSGLEDLKHMMFMCDRAKLVWNYLGVWRHIEELANGDRTGQQMIEEVIKGERKVPYLNNVGLAELILTGSWYIWWERRGFVHGESVQNASRSAMSIAFLSCNYMRAQSKTTKVCRGWKKPPKGKLMVNIDAGFAAGLGSSSVVIRDSSGGFITTSMSFLPVVLDDPMAEAYALKEGLNLLNQIGCRNFIVQSDCQEVIDTMMDGGFTASATAPIFEDCYNIWKDLPMATIEHCDREANQVAHELARQALVAKASCIWVDLQPTFITALLANDVTLDE
jgi:ribonuclease HI